MSGLAGERRHYQGFDVELHEPGIAVATFNKPDRVNAMGPGARRDLCEFLQLAQLDDAIRVIVLTATGRGFIAGVDNRRAGEDPEEPTLTPPVPDNSSHQPANLSARLVTFAQDPVRTIRRLDKITIAAVNGYAIQLGLSVVLACDYAVAARSARLGSATLRMGWQPDEGGHWLLVEHLGVKRALDFVLRKRIVDAETAEQLGLVTEVVDDDQLMAHTLALATELAEGPQVAMRLLKKAVYNAARLSFDQAGEDIAVRTAVSDFHADAVEGRTAFFAKRPAVFNRWLAELDDPDG
jgi:2-(1,2-epoxy-1,2-dihydrophenyl)acetyl-CoA isomerase